ncbi:hypothetical protein KIPB_009631, partial [Kipferlia bialata]|eukprot:g9631.t1
MGSWTPLLDQAEAERERVLDARQQVRSDYQADGVLTYSDKVDYRFLWPVDVRENTIIGASVKQDFGAAGDGDLEDRWTATDVQFEAQYPARDYIYPDIRYSLPSMSTVSLSPPALGLVSNPIRGTLLQRTFLGHLPPDCEDVDQTEINHDRACLEVLDQASGEGTMQRALDATRYLYLRDSAEFAGRLASSHNDPRLGRELASLLSERFSEEVMGPEIASLRELPPSARSTLGAVFLDSQSEIMGDFLRTVDKRVFDTKQTLMKEIKKHSRFAGALDYTDKDAKAADLRTDVFGDGEGTYHEQGSP